MEALDRARKRAERHTVNSLKDRTFERRLLKDYNKEEVTKYGETEKSNVIIQTSKLSEKYDYKKISAPFALNLEAGDIVFWDRVGTYWLVYYQRNTEKDYFLGEIREANYLIKWKDNYGVVREQLGSFSRNEPSVFKDAQFGSGSLQYVDGTAYLMLPKNNSSLLLKRYHKFIIGRLTWEVQGFDETTYNNIILFSLKEAMKNDDTDTTEIPNGQVIKAASITSNLDEISEVLFGSQIEIKPKTMLNGALVQDSYSYETINCTIENGVVSFNEDDEVAEIIIISDNTLESKTYELLISKTPAQETVYTIQGDGGSTIKAQISYKYQVYRNINGTLEEASGVWSVDSKDVTIVEQSGHSCKIKPLTYGVFNLSVEVENGETVSMEITARPLF